MKAKNEKEFLELIDKYRELAIEGLPEETITASTGFGSTWTCTLCTPTKTIPSNDDERQVCTQCVYGVTTRAKAKKYACIKYDNAETYEAISEADDANNLTDVELNNRADRMEVVWKEYQKQLED